MLIDGQRNALPEVLNNKQDFDTVENKVKHKTHLKLDLKQNGFPNQKSTLGSTLQMMQVWLPSVEKLKDYSGMRP